MPCLYCRKMCCLNGSRKLHFVQKIRLDRIIKYMGPEGFFAHLRNFLQVLDLLIFLQKQPGHWAEVVCIFTLLLYPYFVCQMAMETSAGKSKKYLLSQLLMDIILFEQIFKKINSQICDREEKMKKNGI